ncbi:MAG: SusC/RagA family TonB-linked outer membrane protein, partial [Paludibacter sp.]|nr:SusC/RagA family TonB-linked outer membrane protein [Bacteroidales bacterium]MCM1069319.1 SusC/RagA family TonB-linked outer membrane protein [Prevotella sp.]MCM1353698.1 SusC/RagA family TonB-linked outer membrane protein [Bacteroides sp.]MCM1442234.1 SusC/RagA family TonB-linked outer membrane protein [Muribaculum sp.]MCM1482196.1 SusC/RagA family TonB-linked outer membrane protein [Paludibacter sp.]
SATAIYGSRASNGVIIITTKKGAAGQKLKVNYSGNVSMSNLTKKTAVMTGDELRTYAGQLGLSASKLSKLGTANTDWQNEIYRAAISTDHNISLTGGTKHMPYRFSIGYTDQNGIIKTSNMQRVTVAMNLSPSFFDNHLTLNLNAKGLYIYNHYADGGVVGGSIAYDPTCPVMDESLTLFDGYYGRTQSGKSLNDSDPMWSKMFNSQTAANPVSILNQKNDRANSGAFVGNLEADYKIHGLEDLRLHANFGADYSYGKQRTSWSPYSQNTAWGYYGYEGSEEKHKYNLLFNAYAQYYKDFSESQHFDIMAGYEWQHFYNDYYQQGGGMYPTTNNDAALRGTPKDFKTYNSATESYLVSFFGRANWIGWNQLMLTATFRADGSSRFAPEHRWGLFPSVALGWKIKETFLRDVNWLDELKLRLGYGITGQQEINQGDYPYMPIYVVNQSDAYSTIGETPDQANLTGLTEGVDYKIGNDGYVYYKTYRPNEYNPELTWEKTTTYNAGIDFAFLNNRISGAIDYYYRNTTDLINMVDVPAGTNFKTRVISNIGSLFNQGVEFSINAVAIDRKNFKWDLGFNATWNQNRITKLTNSDDPSYFIPQGDIGNSQTVQAHAVGHPASSFYVYQTKYDTEGNLVIVDQQNPELFPGDKGYSIDANQDKIFYHSPAPDVLLGFNTKFQFYGFDLGITLRASIGNYVYNNVLQDQLQYVTTIYDAKFEGYHNVLKEAYNAYYYDNCKLRNETDGVLTDYFVQNASFLRCDNITLGYTWNKPKLNARLYLTVSNPFVISGYKGLDPEIADGIDNNMYPRAMTTLIGCNITF